MFQSTQCLTFRSLPSLRHFKIHPPLPLTPRESKQLLNLLTTSFRRQLDHEHGTTGSESGSTDEASKSFSSSKPEPGKRRRHSLSRSDFGPLTDRHLLSVLTHPLFRDIEKASGTSSQQLRDPMEIFDDACAKGFMKVEYAAACLKAERRKILQSSALSVRDAMKLSGAGSKTLKWMLYSGVADDCSFLQDKVFSKILVDFLVAEGQESVIWMWLETLTLNISSANTKLSTIPPVRDTANLLYYLVRAQTSGPTSLDDAFRSLVRAENMLSRLRYKSRLMLKSAVEFLYFKVVGRHTSHPASSPEMFDSFLSIVLRVISSSNDTALPQLLLYHPEKPDAKPALKYLEKVVNIASTAPDPEAQRVLLRANHYDDKRTIYLGLRTARFLLERDLHAKAHWVMMFLEGTYGKHLGLSQKEMLSLSDHVQAEASSIELLNSLNMA